MHIISFIVNNDSNRKYVLSRSLNQGFYNHMFCSDQGQTLCVAYTHGKVIT